MAVIKDPRTRSPCIDVYSTAVPSQAPLVKFDKHQATITGLRWDANDRVRPAEPDGHAERADERGAEPEVQ